MGWSLSRLSVAAILAWLGLLFYISTSLVKVQTPPASGEEDARTAEALRRIDAASADVQALRKQNEDLRRLIAARAFAPASGDAIGAGLGHLSRAHEELRRRLRSGVWELWYATRGRLARLRSAAKAPKLRAELDAASTALEAQWASLAAVAEELGAVDGADEWRRSALANLSASVQSELARLQSPKDCASARRLVCQLNKGCGFGCQIHHAAYCAIVAFATRRTLLLDTKGWRYSSKGWNSVFLPVAPACDGVDPSDAVQWKGPDAHENDLAVSLPIVDSLRPSPAYLPLSFPSELAEPLLHLHGNPPVWWVAQFVAFLMRFSEPFAKELAAKAAELKLASPIVGIHVRRTDKLGAEAQFHALNEYMEWAERWAQRRRLSSDGAAFKRRAFLATDDKDLLKEAREAYPAWEFIGSADVAASAQLSSRYSDASLRGVLQDIHFLAEADHLVCTFSSQVCRVAYELAQVRRGDRADAFDSLDDLFYFGGQHGHEVVAVLPHKPTDDPPNQLEMRVGDVIGIAGNHWDGWSKGRNMRSSELGLFPSYKVREKWRIMPFRGGKTI